MSVNKVILIGRLGRDPELRQTSTGTSVVNFSIATTAYWKDKEDSSKKHEKTQWHRIVAWGKTAELAGKFLTKGRECYVEGRIESRDYQNKDDQTIYVTEIIADKIQFLGGKPDKES